MTNLNDLLDNVFFNKPIKKSAEIKETIIDVSKILGEAEDDSTLDSIASTAVPEPTEPPTETAPSENGETKTQPIPEEDAMTNVDTFVKRARKIASKHEPKGELVLEIALQLEGKSCGKLQIGSEEYSTLTGWKIIFDKFGIKSKAVPESIKSFRIDCETKYSQTENESVSIAVELAGDGETLGIQVFYNEEGTIMDDFEQALNEFNRRYREYIISAINEKVRV